MIIFVLCYCSVTNHRQKYLLSLWHTGQVFLIRYSCSQPRTKPQANFYYIPSDTDRISNRNMSPQRWDRSTANAKCEQKLNRVVTLPCKWHKADYTTLFFLTLVSRSFVSYCPLVLFLPDNAWPVCSLSRFHMDITCVALYGVTLCNFITWPVCGTCLWYIATSLRVLWSRGLYWHMKG